MKLKNSSQVQKAALAGNVEKQVRQKSRPFAKGPETERMRKSWSFRAKEREKKSGKFKKSSC